MELVKDGQFLCEPELRETTKRLISRYLSVDGEAADWVLEPKRAIKKDNLTLTAKFLWLIVRQFLSPHCCRQYCHLGSRSSDGGDDSRVQGGL